MSKLEVEFDRLVEGLRQVDVSDPSVKARREQLARNVDQVNKFLRAMNVERSLRAPLMRLVNALSDADSGVSNDLFRPEPMDLKQSRLPETDAQHKAALSVAVTLLKSDARWKLDAAARHAAKAINMDHNALITFRKNVCSRRSSEAVLNHYFNLLQIARSNPGTPEEKADIIISGVRAEYAPIVQ